MGGDIQVAPISVVHTANDCGGKILPLQHFVTSEGKIRFLGVCEGCNQNAIEEIPLDELKKLCPAPTPPAPNGGPEMSAADVNFLRRLRVGV